MRQRSCLGSREAMRAYALLIVASSLSPMFVIMTRGEILFSWCMGAY